MFEVVWILLEVSLELLNNPLVLRGFYGISGYITVNIFENSDGKGLNSVNDIHVDSSLTRSGRLGESMFRKFLTMIKARTVNWPSCIGVRLLVQEAW